MYVHVGVHTCVCVCVSVCVCECVSVCVLCVYREQLGGSSLHSGM